MSRRTERGVRQEKEVNNICTEKKNVKLSLMEDHIIVYVENRRFHTKT